MQTLPIGPTETETATLRRAALIGLGGACITLAGGTLAQVMRGSSSVFTDQWSFPFGPGAHILLSVLWMASHLMLFVGLAGIRRSTLVGERRTGVVGIDLALAGTALLAVGEVASMCLANATEDSGGAIAVGSVFGIGTLLTAVGMVMVGVVVLRGRRWTGPSAAAPLVFGLVNVGQLVLGPTDLFHVGIIAYGLAAAWLMGAFVREIATSSPTPGRGEAA